MNEAIKIDWKLLGAKLANLSSNEQAEFFKGFVDEVMTWESHATMEMQMAYIREELTPTQREYIATIGFEG